MVNIHQKAFNLKKHLNCVIYYIAKKLIKKSKCNYCKSMLATDTSNIVIFPYLQLLSRGGLTGRYSTFSPPPLFMIDYDREFDAD